MRLYNPSLSRFLSVDPISKKYPELTPYQFASNTPIQAVDLDGLEAWVVYKDVYKDDTKIRKVFDKDLVPISGVYAVTYFHDNKINAKKDFISGACDGQRSYSEYPDMFPNAGDLERPDKKPLWTIEGYGNIITGEVALKVSEKFSFEVGGEVDVIGVSSVSNSFNVLDAPIKTTGIFVTPESDWGANLGGGINFLGIGLEFRKPYNFSRGKLEESTNVEFDLLDYMKVNGTVNGGQKTSNIQFGFPEVKFSMGLGFKVGGYLSLNPQLQLSQEEKTLKTAIDTGEKGNKEKINH